MNKIIEFILYPSVLGLDIFGPLEVFNTATGTLKADRQKSCGYRFRFTAAKKGTVQLGSGPEIVANAAFKEESSADTLLIPGGVDVETAIDSPVFMSYIRKRAKQAKRIISVCKGAFILAAAGLLDGKEATTHWYFANKLSRKHPEVQVNPDAIFVRDGNVYTSAGVTAGIDLALAVVEEDLGFSAALEVSRRLVLYYRRPGFQSQFSAPLKAQQAAGQRFSDLHNWLVNNLNKSISVEKMAAYSAMSHRNFARVFKSETGLSPNKYLETLRLDSARELMIAGNESLDSIADISGFGRGERLRRAFLRRFGVTPSQYRLHFINQERDPANHLENLKNKTT